MRDTTLCIVLNTILLISNLSRLNHILLYVALLETEPIDP